MPKDTGELILKKIHKSMLSAYFNYISSFAIAPNAPFSQSLSHMSTFACVAYICAHMVQLFKKKLSVVWGSAMYIL